jgi:hypothetical protein
METVELGEFDTEREAALAYDRAFIIIHDDDVLPEDLNFPPEESEHVRFSSAIMKKLERERALLQQAKQGDLSL